MALASKGMFSIRSNQVKIKDHGYYSIYQSQEEYIIKFLNGF